MPGCRRRARRVVDASAIGRACRPRLRAQLLIARVATFDWEFMLQKLATLAFWLVAFAFIHARTRERNPAPRAMDMRRRWSSRYSPASRCCCRAVPTLAQAARLNPEFALDGYAAVDPSFRIARDMLGSGTTGDAAGFYSYLRANCEDCRTRPSSQ